MPSSTDKPHQSATPATDARLPILTRYLHQGISGKDVKALQTVLNTKGFKAVAVDSDFGPQTEAAVIAFQKQANINTDGDVGEQTWTALGGESNIKHLPAETLAKLADLAEQEAAKHLSWHGADSEAEKYLTIFRKPMQELHQIEPGFVFYNWCAAFVTYCCRQVGIDIPDIPEGSENTMALVDSWRVWGKQKGYWYPKGTITPKRGDILVFNWEGNTSPLDHLDHIGIVRNYEPNSSEIQTSEGNEGKNRRSDNLDDREISQVVGFIRFN